MKLARIGLSVFVGLTTAALFFPTHGVTGCNGHCVSYSYSVLLRYKGENDAFPMGVSVAAGIAAGIIVYLLFGWLMRRREGRN